MGKKQAMEDLEAEKLTLKMTKSAKLKIPTLSSGVTLKIFVRTSDRIYIRGPLVFHFNYSADKILYGKQLDKLVFKSIFGEFHIDLYCYVHNFFFCTGLMALADLHKKILKTSKSRQDVTE